jgi:hypothetical protein
MFYSRRINPDTQKVEVWECEWSNKGGDVATDGSEHAVLRRTPPERFQ